MSEILLSIVIPSIPERKEKSWDLFEKLQQQINNRLTKPEQVEIIMFTDNRRRSIGKKREGCVQLATGKYVALLDDDDGVSDEYIFLLHQAANEAELQYKLVVDKHMGNRALIPMDEMLRLQTNRIDVICFKSKVTDKFGSYIVDMDLNHTENEAPSMDHCDRYKDIKRTPWHVCAWRTDLAKSVAFADVGYGEDWHWVKQLIEKSKNQIKINEVLHYYFDNPETSAAPTHSNEIWDNPDDKKVKAK